MKFIHENYNEESLEEIQNAHQEIYGIQNTDGNYEGGKIEEIRTAYTEILEDDKENQIYGLKTQIKKLLDELEDDKIKKIDEYLKELIQLEEGMEEKMSSPCQHQVKFEADETTRQYAKIMRTKLYSFN